MPKEEWGVKRICPTTGQRFYDLNASPIVSPYTGEVVTLDTGKTTRTMVADKADKASAKDKMLDDDEDDDVSLDDITDVASGDED
jgi:uncharacterized protein (TIGR02300 family)